MRQGKDQALDRHTRQPDVRRARARDKMHSKMRGTPDGQLGLLVAASSRSDAQAVVKQEPSDGQMVNAANGTASGVAVLVTYFQLILAGLDRARRSSFPPATYGPNPSALLAIWSSACCRIYPWL